MVVKDWPSGRHHKAACLPLFVRRRGERGEGSVLIYINWQRRARKGNLEWNSLKLHRKSHQNLLLLSGEKREERRRLRVSCLAKCWCPDNAVLIRQTEPIWRQKTKEWRCGQHGAVVSEIQYYLILTTSSYRRTLIVREGSPCVKKKMHQMVEQRYNSEYLECPRDYQQ